MNPLQKQCSTWRRLLVLLTVLLQLILLQPSYADFINGDFEDTYTPAGTAHDPITGWTLTGYTFNGNATTAPPTSLAGINLSAGTTPGGISDIIRGPTQTLFDYFLFGATPIPTLLLPVTGLQSAMINLRSVDSPLTKSGSGAANGFTAIAQQATSLSQQVVVQASDIDPNDNIVHVRFKAAPVLENPGHAVNQQPFFAIQLNNITTGRTGSNPLFFEWNYSAQSGVQWKTLTAAGSNSGSNTSYTYTDWQAFDIAPGNAFIHVGDTIELVAVASGCSPGGHDGHLYLDDVTTSIPAGLWVSAVGPQSSTPGSDITYTYTYTNTSGATVNNVQVIANLPQQGTPSSLPAPSTTFVSVTTPTVGTSPSCTGTSPVTCTLGTLLPGQTGTFQLTVNIPSGWALSTGPVNNGNYPISGQGLSALLGPLVQTNLVSTSSLSNLVANVSGLPTTATVGTPYSGTFTCSNTSTVSATGDAPNAACDITNLPAGVSVTGCTISPSNTAWTEPTIIPANQTVSCTVAGTPTTSGTVTASVTTNASNNSNSTTNEVTASINVSVASSIIIPATVGGSVVINPAIVCCGRPVLLGSLPVPGNGPTSYVVIGQTGDVNCMIGQSGSQTYFRMHGKSGGSCTIVGIKNNIISAPLTVIVP